MIVFNGRIGVHAATTEFDCHEYRKTATVRAFQMEHRFGVVTEEGLMHGDPGDWLAEGPGGECWPIKAEIFAATYEAVE